MTTIAHNLVIGILLQYIYHWYLTARSLNTNRRCEKKYRGGSCGARKIYFYLHSSASSWEQSHLWMARTLIDMNDGSRNFLLQWWQGNRQIVPRSADCWSSVHCRRMIILLHDERTTCTRGWRRSINAFRLPRCFAKLPVHHFQMGAIMKQQGFSQGQCDRELLRCAYPQNAKQSGDVILSNSCKGWGFRQWNVNNVKTIDQPWRAAAVSLVAAGPIRNAAKREIIRLTSCSTNKIGI